IDCAEVPSADVHRHRPTPDRTREHAAPLCDRRNPHSQRWRPLLCPIVSRSLQKTHYCWCLMWMVMMMVHFWSGWVMSWTNIVHRQRSLFRPHELKSPPSLRPLPPTISKIINHQHKKNKIKS